MLTAAEEEMKCNPNCPFSFECGNLRRIRFPFTVRSCEFRMRVVWYDFVNWKMQFEKGGK